MCTSAQRMIKGCPLSKKSFSPMANGAVLFGAASQGGGAPCAGETQNRHTKTKKARLMRLTRRQSYRQSVPLSAWVSARKATDRAHRAFPSAQTLRRRQRRAWPRLAPPARTCAQRSPRAASRRAAPGPSAQSASSPRAGAPRLTRCPKICAARASLDRRGRRRAELEREVRLNGDSWL